MAQYKVFMHEFKFVKMNGLGNDFVVIDQRVSEFDLSKEQIKLICNRTDGVGCDQLIMIRKSQDNIYPMVKFFNSDGTEIDACGNGSRCVANFLMKETKSEKINLTTRERTIACEKIDDVTVSVNMGKPKFKWNEIPLTKDVDPEDINFSIRDLTLKKPFLVNIGNPHIIFFDDEIEKYDVESFGSLIENDSLFPEKINVSFAKLKSDNHIVLNVWERGAGKTNACGTAACATAVAGVEMGVIKNKVTVTLPGGDLEIYYKSSDNIIMTGPTEINFTDKYKL